AGEEEGPEGAQSGRRRGWGRIAMRGPPGVPGRDGLGEEERLDGQVTTPTDHPDQVADDGVELESSDRGGFLDGEAAFHQAPGPFLGRDVPEGRRGAGGGGFQVRGRAPGLRA